MWAGGSLAFGGSACGAAVSRPAGLDRRLALSSVILFLQLGHCWPPLLCILRESLTLRSILSPIRALTSSMASKTTWNELA